MLIEGEGGTGKSTLVAALLDTAQAQASTYCTAARGNCRPRSRTNRWWPRSADMPVPAGRRRGAPHRWPAHPRRVDRVARSRTAGDRPRGIQGACAGCLRHAHLQDRCRPAGRARPRRPPLGRPGQPRGAPIPVPDLPDIPMLLLLTSRAEEADRHPEVRQLLATLRRSPWSSTIRLDRLERPAIDAARGGAPRRQRHAAVYELVAARSGGTPLLVHELLDDLVERGVIAQRGEVWELCGDEMPSARSATDLIRSLDRVEAHDRAVLEALAIVNGPTDPRRRRPARRRARHRRGFARAVAQHPPGDPDRPSNTRFLYGADPVRLEMDGRTPGRRRCSWRPNSSTPWSPVDSTARCSRSTPRAPLGRRARARCSSPASPPIASPPSPCSPTPVPRHWPRATPSAAIEPLSGALSLLRDDDDRGAAAPDRTRPRHCVSSPARSRSKRSLDLRAAVELWWSPPATLPRALSCSISLDNAEFRAGNGGASATALLDWIAHRHRRPTGVGTPRRSGLGSSESCGSRAVARRAGQRRGGARVDPRRGDAAPTRRVRANCSRRTAVTGLGRRAGRRSCRTIPRRCRPVGLRIRTCPCGICSSRSTPPRCPVTRS